MLWRYYGIRACFHMKKRGGGLCFRLFTRPARCPLWATAIPRWTGFSPFDRPARATGPHKKLYGQRLQGSPDGRQGTDGQIY